MDYLLKFTDLNGNRCAVPINCICGVRERKKDQTTVIIIHTIDEEEYSTSDITFKDICNIIEAEEGEVDETDYPECHRS